MVYTLPAPLLAVERLGVWEGFFVIKFLGDKMNIKVENVENYEKAFEILHKLNKNANLENVNLKYANLEKANLKNVYMESINNVNK